MYWAAAFGDVFPYFHAVFPVLCIAPVTKDKTTPVFVPYSCMDTSSKSWLPHQSQFGLVGQAEVCCGGPGVLTPSECVRPPVDCSVCCTFASSSPVCGAPLKTFCYICVINVQPAASCESHRHLCCHYSLIPLMTGIWEYSGFKGSDVLVLLSTLLPSLFYTVQGWRDKSFSNFFEQWGTLLCFKQAILVSSTNKEGI